MTGRQAYAAQSLFWQAIIEERDKKFINITDWEVADSFTALSMMPTVDWSFYAHYKKAFSATCQAVANDTVQRARLKAVIRAVTPRPAWGEDKSMVEHHRAAAELLTLCIAYFRLIKKSDRQTSKIIAILQYFSGASPPSGPYC